MCRRRSKEQGSSSGPSVLLLFSLVLLTTSVAIFRGIESYLRKTRKLNKKRTRRLLDQVLQEEAEESTADEAEYDYLKESNRDQLVIVGFFHPFCNAGGGGERVLFQALAHHQEHDPNLLCVVYTGDLSEDVSKADILDRARQRFNIKLKPSRVHFVPLTRRFLVEDGYWNHFTLLGQSLGAAILGAEAMAQLVPDIFIDTMGYAFSYPVVRLFAPDIPIGAYVHYPTISTDMLSRVRNRTAGHTNDATVAGSTWRTYAKLIYYHLFASAYTYSLSRADAIVANSSWTKAHLDTLIYGSRPKAGKKPVPELADTQGQKRKRRQRLGVTRRKQVEIVYPPCDTTAFSAFPLEGSEQNDGRDPGLLVSLAQFRPEKEHATQIRLLRALFDLEPAYRTGGNLTAPSSSSKSAPKVRLMMMGSCRNQGDEARIEGLKALAKDLGVEDSVSFMVNAPFKDILSTLSRASIGLSTMVDEHFGINVVEFMAAGLITLSHASAGPYLDIAVPVLASADSDPLPTGFHALDPPSFASTLSKILQLSKDEEAQIRSRARDRAIRCFGSQGFEEAWRGEVWDMLWERERQSRAKAIKDR
ncbi:asparagine-linked glycosylation protein [Tilletia horrida]|uniref:GDP-Man:Man(3)GlcNAc(2)-PP-Dol alpha-1,2-mannosyltransferase n=1 Tax=Tilletia horrida TaxID=155126 RepID=A0AAN6GR16_9BASI|nr:asparagine-linked glycosylation protein [Tilletia horrida]KAK0546521.1 asparagine-linked glycosylation protein [Tilletia horrida]KAK0562312.1 asparagine-linked glycosylation protein [Tilletia horrida]